MLRNRAPRITLLLIAGVFAAFPLAVRTSQVLGSAVYRPKLASSNTVEQFLKHLEPGDDGFPLERQVVELDARLRELSDALRSRRSSVDGVISRLLDTGFRGARLRPGEAVQPTDAPLDVRRATDLPRDATLDARAFGAEFRRLIDDLRDVSVAEFLITSIEPDGDS